MRRKGRWEADDLGSSSPRHRDQLTCRTLAAKIAEIQPTRNSLRSRNKTIRSGAGSKSAGYFVILRLLKGTPHLTGSEATVYTNTYKASPNPFGIDRGFASNSNEALGNATICPKQGDKEQFANLDRSRNSLNTLRTTLHQAGSPRNQLAIDSSTKKSRKLRSGEG